MTGWGLTLTSAQLHRGHVFGLCSEPGVLCENQLLTSNAACVPLIVPLCCVATRVPCDAWLRLPGFRGQPWAALCCGFPLGGQVPQESPGTACLSAHDYKVLSSRKTWCCLVSLKENKSKPTISLLVCLLHSS